MPIREYVAILRYPRRFGDLRIGIAFCHSGLTATDPRSNRVGYGSRGSGSLQPPSPTRGTKITAPSDHSRQSAGP